jgi:transposase
MPDQQRRQARTVRHCPGRESWLFAGSVRGGQRAAAMYTLMVTARLNNVDPLAWFTDVLGKIGERTDSRLNQLLPWNWRTFDAAAA